MTEKDEDRFVALAKKQEAFCMGEGEDLTPAEKTEFLDLTDILREEEEDRYADSFNRQGMAMAFSEVVWDVHGNL